MKPQDHVTKARRIEATVTGKLDPDKHYELCIEAYMLAGTHFMNAALHRLAVTKENGDLNHSDRLKGPIDESLRPLLDALKRIEDLRDGYLRGTDPWKPEDGRRCRESYEEVKRLAETALG